MGYEALDPLVDQGVRVGVDYRDDHRHVSEVLLHLEVRIGAILAQTVTRVIEETGERLVRDPVQVGALYRMPEERQDIGR